MAIYYQVKVKQTNTVVFDDILANSEKEARQVAEYNAEQEFADKMKKYEVTSQAFSQEDDKIFVATYSKPKRDIGDPVEPNYVNVYEVRANHKVERSSEWDKKPYYQLRHKHLEEPNVFFLERLLQIVVENIAPFHLPR